MSDIAPLNPKLYKDLNSIEHDSDDILKSRSAKIYIHNELTTIYFGKLRKTTNEYTVYFPLYFEPQPDNFVFIGVLELEDYILQGKSDIFDENNKIDSDIRDVFSDGPATKIFDKYTASVRSVLNKNIVYSIFTLVNDNIETLSDNIYSVSLNDKEIEIALGKIRDDSISKYNPDSIGYFPVYILEDDLVGEKIGIYEFYQKDMDSIYNSEKEIDFTKLSELNFFPSFNKKFTESPAIQIDESTKSVSPVMPESDVKPTSASVRGSPVISELDEDDESVSIGKSPIVSELDEDDKSVSVKGSPVVSESDEDDESVSVGDFPGASKFDDDDDKSVSVRDSPVVSESDGDESVLVSEPSDSDDDDESISVSESPVLSKSSDDEGASTKPVKYTNWLQKYMKDSQYGITDNEGGGDCLFASIRDGFSTIDREISVDELRKILADEADEELFQQYRTIYMTFNSVIESLRQANLDIKKKHSKIKNKANSLIKTLKSGKVQKKSITKLKGTIKNMALKASEYEKQYKGNKNELEEQLRAIEDFKFMKGIDSLKKFKNVIKSCEFWGETWSISTLERVLNIKIILLKKQSDSGSHILCGQLNDDKLEIEGEFNPDHYIILEYSGNHYKLITYNGKGALKFSEISKQLKEKIVETCLKKKAGPYYIIPDFKEFIEKQHSSAVSDSIMDEEESKIDDIDDLDSSTIFKIGINEPDTKPGYGINETINPEKDDLYSELNEIKDWRKKLSREWKMTIEIDDMLWSSIEHYYQAQKFKKHHPELYKQFSISHSDDDGKLAKDVKLAKEAGNPENDYFSIPITTDDTIDIQELLDEANVVKFSNEDMANILYLTRDAILTYEDEDGEIQYDISLMQVRNMFEAESDTDSDSGTVSVTSAVSASGSVSE